MHLCFKQYSTVEYFVVTCSVSQRHSCQVELLHSFIFCWQLPNRATWWDAQIFNALQKSCWV